MAPGRLLIVLFLLLRLQSSAAFRCVSHCLSEFSARLSSRLAPGTEIVLLPRLILSLLAPLTSLNFGVSRLNFLFVPAFPVGRILLLGSLI